MTWTPELVGATVFAGLAFILLLVVAARMNALQSRIAVLGRIEGKIDLLLTHADLKYDPLAHVASDVADAIRRNQKIEAIKLYREATGVGLKEAKDYVEGMQRRGGLG
jgi:ribosomal protein L7/L12